MNIFPIKTRIIIKDESVFKVFTESVLNLKDKTIVCVASKVVAYEQGRIVKVDEDDFSELVARESDTIVSGGKWALTVKDGNFVCNAGIDRSNVEKGFAVLWPKNIWNWAENFRKQLCTHYGVKNVGVVITDSKCTPLRLGVTGFALAWSGFEGIADERNKNDLFGNTMEVTQRHLADGIAAAASLLMGESNESTPFALIQKAPVVFTDRTIDANETLIPPEEDLFRGK